MTTGFGATVEPRNEAPKAFGDDVLEVEPHSILLSLFLLFTTPKMYGSAGWRRWERKKTKPAGESVIFLLS